MGSNPFVGERARRYDDFLSTPYGRAVYSLERELLSRLLPREPLSSLEVGCGTGLWLPLLRELFRREPVCLDLSLDMLLQAKRKGARKSVLADGGALPFKDGSFDLVAFITSLEFMEKPLNAAVEALRVSRKFVLVGFLNGRSPLNLYRRFYSRFRRSSYGYAKFYSKRELRQLFEEAARRLGKKVEFEKWLFTINFSLGKRLFLPLERLTAFKLPFGAFGATLIRVE